MLKSGWILAVSLVLLAAVVPCPAAAQVEDRGSEWVRIRSAARLMFGWRVGVSAASLQTATFFDAVDAAASPLFLRVIEGDSNQKVSVEIPKNLDYNLTPAEIEAVRRKLATAGVRMVTYSAGTLGPSAADTRRLFEFAKSLNVEIIVASPDLALLPALDKLANEFGVSVAVENAPAYSAPERLLIALQGRSQRLGVRVDLGPWRREGIKPLAGLTLLKDRLLAVNLRDLSGAPELLMGMYRSEIKPLVLTVDGRGTAELSRALLALEKALQPAAGDYVAKLSRATPTNGPARLSPEVRAKIEAAIPRQAPATPKKPRKLLVMDLTVAYPPTDHLEGAAAATLVLELLSQKTGAFQAVFSNDFANLKYEKLKEFDGLYLNNTVGQLFPDPEIRDSLLRYVREGGGLAGHHGTSHASQDWPEFSELIGARGGTHRSLHETVTVKLDDTASPINAAFKGQGFEFVDEFYRYPFGPYSREKLHLLLSFDVEKTDMNQTPACPRCARPDNDYGISWIRGYGKGRVFYCSLGHNPTAFMTPSLVEHILAGIQFALGDLASDTTPSAKLASQRRP